MKASISMPMEPSEVAVELSDAMVEGTRDRNAHSQESSGSDSGSEPPQRLDQRTGDRERQPGEESADEMAPAGDLKHRSPMHLFSTVLGMTGVCVHGC